METNLKTAFVVALFLSVITGGRVHASPEMDRRYELKTVGVLKSWDNVDGLFENYVRRAFENYFSKHPRFKTQDLSRAEAVLTNSTLSYKQLINDREVLGELSRSTRAQSIIRTQVTKHGAEYHFEVDWLLSPGMETIAEEKFNLTEMGSVEAKLQEALDRVVKKVPVLGTITGVDHSTVTVDLGSESGLKVGDVLSVSTIDEVKKHPLLKKVVGWDLTPTGRVRIEQVEDSISFGRIVEQVDGREIRRFQKVVRVVAAAPRQPVGSVMEDDSEIKKRLEDLAEPPRMGFGAAALWAGIFKRQYSSLNNTIGKTGSGLFIGAKSNLQLWLTREWFAEANFAYGFTGYTQSDISSGQQELSGNVSALGLGLDFGYTYYLSPSIFGPKGWVKLGYQTFSYSLPISEADAIGPSSFKGLFLGLGGDLPIRGPFGAQVMLDLGLLTSVKETGFDSGSVVGSSFAHFFVGGFYRTSQRMSFTLGVDVTSNGAEFSNDATLTHRVVSFGPSVIMYF